MKPQIINTELTIPNNIDCDITRYIISNYEDIIRGKSKETTRSTYRNNGKWFVSFLISQGGFHKNTFPDFVEFLRKQTKSIASQAARCTAAKYIVKRVNILNEIVLPDRIYGRLMKFDDWVNAPNESTKKGQSIGELEHIKDAIELIEDGAKRTKMKAQFSLLALQGLRASEAARLEVKDFNLKDKIKTVNVLRKGGKREDVRLFNASVRMIKQYLRFNGIEGGYLFLNRKGECISRVTLSSNWKAFFKKIGLEKYSIHDFRHALATRLAVDTKNAFAVKSVLGHKSLNTSQRYVDKVAYDKIHLDLDKTIEY